MAVMASVRRTQEPMITSNGASLNVVAVAILLAAIAAGAVGKRRFCGIRFPSSSPR